MPGLVIDTEAILPSKTALLAKMAGEREKLVRELTPQQKQRRVVLKRVNLDKTEIRSNFLNAGTMARGAGESGKVSLTRSLVVSARLLP